MAKLTVTRPNGDTEYAELTTNRSLVGEDYLTVEKYGTTYYAKLASNISTHMYVIKPYSSTKLYVQKEVKFIWEYTFNGTEEQASKMVIPRTGKYEMYIEGTENSYDDYSERPFTTTFTDVFIKGTKVIDGSYIQSQGGRKYYLQEDNRDCGDEACVGVTSSMKSIEYVGEA